MKEFGDIQYIRAKDVKLHEKYFVFSLEPIITGGFGRAFEPGEVIIFETTALAKYVFSRSRDPGKRYSINPCSSVIKDLKLVRELPANFIGAMIMTKKLEDAVGGPDRLERNSGAHDDMIYHALMYGVCVVRQEAVISLVNPA